MRLSKPILCTSVLVAAVITMTACTVAGTPQAASVKPAQTVVALPAPSTSVTAAPPTVAKTQRRVQIFSGPSDQPVRQAANDAPGTHDLELKATSSQQIGAFLTDGNGMTLYRFDKDSDNPPRSNCAGPCATTWPPLLIASPGRIFPSGVDPQLIGYVERADGTCQVTVNGWPVYHYSGDKAPGETNGQGVQGTWFAVPPTGGKAGK